VVLQYDYSRTYWGAVDITGKPYTGERARPIQTLIWYPAEAGGARLKFGDYTALFATEQEFAASPGRAAAVVAEARGHFDADPDGPMQAIRDAKPESGRYPVVIYAPSFSAPAFENADLCEYLASFESLMSELGTKGFSHAAEVYAAMKAATRTSRLKSRKSSSGDMH
jgi:hypothetical protein